MNDNIGDRMKRNYENPYQITLPNRIPKILRELRSTNYILQSLN